jgi:2,4-didehydro-3-deoxy-L-rhamnonate hydrolase
VLFVSFVVIFPRHLLARYPMEYVSPFLAPPPATIRAPTRIGKKREKDVFFDWLHGKWHDSFCPCGPCLASPSEIPDPQNLAMLLMVNGEVKQQASTGLQIFPVAAVIEFISSFVTLEPGDIISTGTPAGVGNTTGQYLQPGDQVEASITPIGKLVSPVQAEPTN